MPARQSNAVPSRLPFSRSAIPASENAMSRAPRQARCSQPIPSSWAGSRAWERSPLRAVVDTYDPYALGFPHVSREPEALRSDLDAWVHYKTERPYLRYRNQGGGLS